MPRIFSKDISVLKEDIDINGHVNNITYVKWMQELATEHSDAQGWAFEDYQTAGSAWFIRSHYIEYLIPALADDEIIAYTWVHDMKRIKSMRKYKFVRKSDGKTLAKAETQWVFVDNKTGRPKPVLPEVASAFEVIPVDEEP